MRPAPPDISAVVPFFDEEASAFAVVVETAEALAALGGTWEAILVNDGSSDRTGSELERAARERPQCRIITLPRNRGQGFALFAGIVAARAPVIATLDGDGQNPPGEIAALLPLLAHADLVVGVRSDRRDTALRRVLSRLANAVRGRVLRDRLSDAGCALKVFRKDVVASLRPLPMLNCFMPALAMASGFRVAEHPVLHRPRAAGRAKYGLRVMLWRPFLGMLEVRRMVRSGGKVPC